MAEANLARQGYRAYLPRLKARRRVGGRQITTAIALFPGYLFVALDLDREATGPIKSTYGAVGLVAFGGHPAALPAGVIPDIQAREAADGLVHEDAFSRMRPGAPVAISEGPLADSDALFQTSDGRNRVVVLMNLLGRNVPVRTSGDKIRAVS